MFSPDLNKQFCRIRLMLKHWKRNYKRISVQFLKFYIRVVWPDLAELNFVSHGSAHVVDVVVDHWESDADGEDCNHGEGHSRVGHKAVRLQTALDVQHLLGLVVGR